MKKQTILLVFCAVVLSWSATSQRLVVTQTTVAKKATELVKFSETAHYFGKIIQGVSVAPMILFLKMLEINLL